MTSKIFRLMFLTGLLVVSSLSSGCSGLFGGDKEKLTSLQLQNENLRGQLERTEHDLDRAEEDKQDLQDELLLVKSELATKPAPEATAPGTSETITVSGSVLFVVGAADLTSAGKSRLASIASDIRSRYPGQRISVEGHTDNEPMVVTKPKWGTNMWLSANRARAVADYLISRGIREELVRVVGWGGGKPTGRGRNQDRRVEIIILSR